VYVIYVNIIIYSNHVYVNYIDIIIYFNHVCSLLIRLYVHGVLYNYTMILLILMHTPTMIDCMHIILIRRSDGDAMGQRKKHTGSIQIRLTRSGLHFVKTQISHKRRSVLYKIPHSRKHRLRAYIQY